MPWMSLKEMFRWFRQDLVSSFLAILLVERGRFSAVPSYLGSICLGRHLGNVNDSMIKSSRKSIHGRQR